MAKRLLITLLVVTIITCSSISVFATEEVAADTNTGNETTQSSNTTKALTAAEEAAAKKEAEEAAAKKAAQEAAAKKAAEAAAKAKAAAAAKAKAAAAKKAAETKLKKGLAAYIRKVNRNVSKSKATSLANSFYNVSKKYNVDVYYLMAIAQNESTFYTNAKAAGGAYRGLMQTSKAMAKRYGYSANQLYNGNVSITVGARCLKGNLSMFKKNYRKALSAYAYGSGAVKSGRYSNYYYNKFTKTRNAIKKYLKSKKYV